MNTALFNATFIMAFVVLCLVATFFVIFIIKEIKYDRRNKEYKRFLTSKRDKREE